MRGQRAPRYEPTPNCRTRFCAYRRQQLPIIERRLRTRRFGGSPQGEWSRLADTRRPIWPNSNGHTAYFPMSAIIFAAAYDLSATLPELRVAIQLCDGRSRNEDCSPRPTQINSISTAAMHTLFPRWVLCHEYRWSIRRCVTVSGVLQSRITQASSRSRNVPKAGIPPVVRTVDHRTSLAAAL